MRADARRNREKVLRAAYEAFASEGLGVSVQEIARRAGVGTGTVSRHFPTKDALYEAIVLDRMEILAGTAERFTAERDPGEAFVAFFGFMVDQGALDHGLADALSGGGFDIVTAARGTGHNVLEILNGLLARAQEAGEIRADVDAADVKALITGCIERGRGEADEDARRRTMAVVLAGLRSRA